MMLTDYLDFKSKNPVLQSSALPASSESGGSTSTNMAEPTADMNSFFVRRKAQRPKRESIFRFDYSSTALSMNDYIKEQAENENRSKTLICPANPHNITPIYPALMEFINIIETALKCEPGYKYLSKCLSVV